MANLGKVRLIFSKEENEYDVLYKSIFQDASIVGEYGLHEWLEAWFDDSQSELLDDAFGDIEDGSYELLAELCALGDGEDVEFFINNGYKLDKLSKEQIDRLEFDEREVAIDETEFRAEGNDGEDFFSIKQDSDNMVRVKMGSGCVYVMDHIIPVVALVNTIVDVDNVKKAFRECGHNKEYVENLIKKIKQVPQSVDFISEDK